MEWKRGRGGGGLFIVILSKLRRMSPLDSLMYVKIIQAVYILYNMMQHTAHINIFSSPYIFCSLTVRGTA